VRKFRHRLCDYAADRIGLSQVTDSVRGWVNHVRYANTVGLREVIFQANPVPKRGMI